MGFFLFIAAMIAVVAGLVAGLICALVGLLVGLRQAKRRTRAGATWAISTAIVTLLVVLATWAVAQRPVRPGSDYDNAAFNMAVRGFGFALAPGVGFGIGGLAILFCPRRKDRPGRSHETIAPNPEVLTPRPTPARTERA